MNLISPPASPRPQSPHSPASGFTLIELLTVIAIVAVLAAITLATISGVRSTAKRARCVSNLRQLGVGAAAYSQDNKLRTLPPQFFDALQKGAYLPPLTKNDMLNCSGIWMCPEDTKDRTAVADNSVNVITNISYGYNAQRIGLPPTYWTTSKITLNQIENPSRTLYIADCDTYYMNKSASNQNAVFRHRGKINVLFFDGHVAGLSEPSPLSQFYNDVL